MGWFKCFLTKGGNKPCDVEKFKVAVENSHDQINITDAEGIVLFINKSTEAVTGFNRDEVIGKKIGNKDLWGGLMEKSFYQNLWKTIKTEKKQFKGSIRNKRKNGDAYNAELSITPILNKNGRVKYFVAVETDLTPTEQLENANIKIETFLRSIGDGLIITDQDGKITFVNEVAEALLNVPQAELLNKTLAEQLPLYDEKGKVIPVAKTPQVQALVKFSKIESGKYFYKRKEELFPIYLTVNPITLGTRSIGTVQVFRDITNEKNIDRAKTEFISLASHQLRTPITAMRWYIEMLIDNKDSFDKDSASQLEELERANSRLISIVTSLLNISRIELGTFAVDPVETNLEEIAKGVFKDLAPKIIEKKHKIEEYYDPDAVKVVADPKLTQMVIQNLVSNAIKYTRDKGNIKISVTRREVSDVATDKISTNRKEILISVSDNGIGIPQKFQSKMFQKMFRAENAVDLTNDGNGLGLYIVKGIVEAQGGKIWFESEQDKGATFYFTIPAEGVKKVIGSKTLDG